MAKISSVAELKKKREELQAAAQAAKPVINVSLATCSIASGGNAVMEAIKEEVAAQGLDVVLMKSGCMTYCYAEPTVQITLPGKEPVMFGPVDVEKAKLLVDKYVKGGELVEGVGVIPVGYERVVF
jgi:NADP-reducing hydrogenase subunit HndB